MKEIVLDRILAGDDFVVEEKAEEDQFKFIDKERYGMEEEVNETESKKY